MRKINSNIGTWILSSFGTIAIAFSVALLFPNSSRANQPASCTASCGSSGSVSCNGDRCAANDGVGCYWTDENGINHFRSC